MIRDDVCYLVTETPGAHGVFDQASEMQRMVYCTVRSVGMSEFYRAKEYGLEPAFVIDLSDAIEYRGEKICIYNGRRYNIIRTYQNGIEIELTVEEAKVDA